MARNDTIGGKSNRKAGGQQLRGMANGLDMMSSDSNYLARGGRPAQGANRSTGITANRRGPTTEQELQMVRDQINGKKKTKPKRPRNSGPSTTRTDQYSAPPWADDGEDLMGNYARQQNTIRGPR